MPSNPLDILTITTEQLEAYHAAYYAALRDPSNSLVELALRLENLQLAAALYYADHPSD